MGLHFWIMPQRLTTLSSMGRRLDHRLANHKWRGLLPKNYGFRWLNEWELISIWVYGELNLP